MKKIFQSNGEKNQMAYKRYLSGMYNNEYANPAEEARGPEAQGRKVQEPASGSGANFSAATRNSKVEPGPVIPKKTGSSIGCPSAGPSGRPNNAPSVRDEIALARSVEGPSRTMPSSPRRRAEEPRVANVSQREVLSLNSYVVHKASSRLEELAKPRSIARRGGEANGNCIPARVLKAKATERTIELSKPRVPWTARDPVRPRQTSQRSCLALINKLARPMGLAGRTYSPMGGRRVADSLARTAAWKRGKGSRESEVRRSASDASTIDMKMKVNPPGRKIKSFKKKKSQSRGGMGFSTLGPRPAFKC